MASKKKTLAAPVTSAQGRRAVELRREARSWEEIADDLNTTPGEAQRLARDALALVVADDVEDLRTESELRLDSLYRETLLEIKFATSGNVKQGAIGLALKIETRRAQLLGLDYRAGQS